MSDWRWRGRGNHGAAGSAGPSVTAGGVTGAAGSAGRGLWLSRHEYDVDSVGAVTAFTAVAAVAPVAADALAASVTA
ncbi:hypothetical protein, partial [Mycobacterium tuberculosis]|uniref:hypothetical protein n=2 Tax=Mycobacterium tuberculosis TaxID=1773 RepID=UPI0039F06803